MIEAAEHINAMMASTTYVVEPPMVFVHKPLKSISPVSLQLSPMRLKECELIVPSVAQIRSAGIHPVPLDMAAERVRRPAPATLFTRLKTDGATSAVAGP